MNHESERAARRRRALVLLLAVWGAGLASAATPDITLSPASLSFSYQTGAALPAVQTLQIKSTGAALSFTLAVSGPLPYLAQWLSVSANSGATAATIKVYVNPTGLPSGSYGGTITINSPSAATPVQTVPVTLDVGDPAATLTASVSTMSFTYVTGGANPATQPVVLSTTGGALTATISITGAAWLSAAPAGTIALVGLPATVTVTADPTGLAPGTYTGKITFTSSTAANKSVSVNVTLAVAAAAPAITAGGIWPPGVVAGSPAITITITGTGFLTTSVASATTAASVTTALTTTPISSTTLLAVVPAALLQPAGSLNITVSTPTAGSASSPAAFAVYGPGPHIWAVADAASYSVAGISPGEIITIFGIGLGPAALTLFSGANPLPDSLPASGAATSVTIGNVAAPLLFTSAHQISCIVPFALAAQSGSKVDLVLTYNAIASTPFHLSVLDVDPGVFTIDFSGAGQGAILNIDPTTGDYSVNGPTNKAPRSSTVVIYATGFGQTNPAGDETQLITASVIPAAAVTVSIGGQAATVQSATVPIGSVPGLLQINATVPATAATGSAVPVIVSVGTSAGPIQSQARVTMGVQ